MENQFVVDLSQRIYPGKEVNFPMELDLRDAAESMPQLQYDSSIWYKIGYVSMCTHNGTHIEVPYHHLEEGLDIANFPVGNLIGNLVLLDFSSKTIEDTITLEELQAHDSEISAGDIVFLKTGMDKIFRTPNWADYPYIALEGIRWLIEKRIGCLGTDAAGIEDILAKNQPGHVTLFRGGIPLVESLTNLEQVESGKYIVFILPIAIEKADACPVRVVAVRKDGLAAMANR